MYLKLRVPVRRRRGRRKKQQIFGKGIIRPYVNKRNRLMFLLFVCFLA